MAGRFVVAAVPEEERLVAQPVFEPLDETEVSVTIIIFRNS